MTIAILNGKDDKGLIAKLGASIAGARSRNDNGPMKITTITKTNIKTTTTTTMTINKTKAQTTPKTTSKRRREETLNKNEGRGIDVLLGNVEVICG